MSGSETFSTSGDTLGRKRKMADSEEQHVSSTTPLFSDEVHHYQAEPNSEVDQPKQDLFSTDDIVDLVGGAHDALERHKAEDIAPQEFTETSPVTLPEPEPVSVPEVKKPEPEVETAIPDSTNSSFDPETHFVAEEPEVVAPKAEPESTNIAPEPQAAREPEPAPASDALPAAEPRKAAAAPVKAAERPAVTEEPPAPASCEYLTGENTVN